MEIEKSPDAVYLKLLGSQIHQSREFKNGIVIIDFDENFMVRGIEFIGGNVNDIFKND